MPLSLIHSPSAAALVLVVFVLGGCSPGLVSVPEPTAADRAIARLAMTVSDVSLMARSGDKEGAIVEEIKRRRVPEKLTGATEEALQRSGISAVLIAALKDETNILTAAQRVAYDEFAAERTVRTAQGEEAARQRLIDQENARLQDRERRKSLAAQTQQNIRVAESRERNYEAAEQAYKARKVSLEQQNISLQASINRLRRYGYHEAEVNGYVKQIDLNTQALRDLKVPMR